MALRCTEILLARLEMDRSQVGLVIGTTLGCLETDREFQKSRVEADGRYASPAAFSRTLPSTVVAEIALKLQLTGPSMVISAGDSSAAMAIRRAVAWMTHFHLEYCIAGGVEWIGKNVGITEARIVGLILLQHADASAIREVRVEAMRAVNLDALEDESLRKLISGSETLGAGVALTKTA